MEGNRDWKVPAALILAGLALFIALSGRNALPFIGAGEDQPRQTILIQNSPPSGSAQVAPTPNVPLTQPSMPYAPVAPHFGWGYGSGGFGHGLGSCLFGLFFLGLLLFVFSRFFGKRRWQGYAGGYGPGHWQGPPPPTPPAQGPQPGQGPGHWEWHADNGAPAAKPNQPDNHGDIMRPGEGDQG